MEQKDSRVKEMRGTRQGSHQAWLYLPLLREVMILVQKKCQALKKRKGRGGGQHTGRKLERRGRVRVRAKG
jgi:hypothetical protein